MYFPILFRVYSVLIRCLGYVTEYAAWPNADCHLLLSLGIHRPTGWR